MKEKSKTQLVLESVFVEAAEALKHHDDGRTVSMLAVQIDVVTGEIFVYDDKETLLAKNIIFEWAERSSRNQNPQRYAIHIMWVALSAMKNHKLFDHHIFERPFTVALVDEDFNRTDVLLSIEDSFHGYEGPLMKNLEHDLNIFMKKVLQI